MVCEKIYKIKDNKGVVVINIVEIKLLEINLFIFKIIVLIFLKNLIIKIYYKLLGNINRIILLKKKLWKNCYLRKGFKFKLF